jgi:hypothetical protein
VNKEQISKNLIIPLHEGYFLPWHEKRPDCYRDHPQKTVSNKSSANFALKNEPKGHCETDGLGFMFLYFL